MQFYNKYCTNIRVTHSDPSNALPPAALREFTKAAKADWQGGVPLAELLARVNRVAVLLVGDEDHAKPAAGRVRRTFTDRSFRHYQTLGSIDVPEKRGRLAAYGFRHFVQALLVRRLLWERMSSERIVALMAGRGTDELQRMLLGGVEIVARAGVGGDEEEQSEPAESLAELWNRVRVVPGVELHLNADLPRFKPTEFKRVMARLKEVLRRQGS